MAHATPPFGPSRVIAVTTEVSATVGRDFFRSLTEHLANAVGAECAYVAEVTKGPVSRYRTVAVYLAGAFAEDFERDLLPGTGAAQVLADGSVAWSIDAARIFPLDPMLVNMGAEGYAGVRLRDTSGRLLGLIALITTRPMPYPLLATSVLETFAPRTAAELQRKRAEEALRESEERYRTFIGSSRDAMWRIEFDEPIPLSLSEEEQIERIYRHGYVAECNEAMSKLVGASDVDAVVGLPFDALFSRDDDRIRQELRSAIRSRYSAATIATTPMGADGAKRYRLRTQCGIVENDALRRIWGTTRDITDLKSAELAVETAERFGEVLENIQLPALILDNDGGIIFCNGWLRGLLQFDNRQLIGKHWLELLSSEQERDLWSLHLFTTPESPDASGHFECPSRFGNDQRLLMWDTVVLRNKDGGRAGLAAIGRDVTDERR